VGEIRLIKIYLPREQHMIKHLLIFLFLFCTAGKICAQQKPLPEITVKNINNKIIISWVNAYAKPVTTLNIQRSYDSLKNFYTIGSVLSPQSRENGYTDDTPPYNKMYYRVFISFEGGSYLFTPPARPVKDIYNDVLLPEKYPWMSNGLVLPKDTTVTDKNAVTYPSLRVFASKENNVVIHLPDAAEKKYAIKFFDENDKFLFELTKLKEEYLIVEKMNFVHNGWFRFEVYENGLLIENNKFQLVKEAKKL